MKKIPLSIALSFVLLVSTACTNLTESSNGDNSNDETKETAIKVEEEVVTTNNEVPQLNDVDWEKVAKDNDFKLFETIEEAIKETKFKKKVTIPTYIPFDANKPVISSSNTDNAEELYLEYNSGNEGHNILIIASKNTDEFTASTDEKPVKGANETPVPTSDEFVNKPSDEMEKDELSSESFMDVITLNNNIDALYEKNDEFHFLRFVKNDILYTIQYHNSKRINEKLDVTKAEDEDEIQSEHKEIATFASDSEPITPEKIEYIKQLIKGSTVSTESKKNMITFEEALLFTEIAKSENLLSKENIKNLEAMNNYALEQNKKHKSDFTIDLEGLVLSEEKKSYLLKMYKEHGVPTLDEIKSNKIITREGEEPTDTSDFDEIAKIEAEMIKNDGQIDSKKVYEESNEHNHEHNKEDNDEHQPKQTEANTLSVNDIEQFITLANKEKFLSKNEMDTLLALKSDMSKRLQIKLEESKSAKSLSKEELIKIANSIN